MPEETPKKARSRPKAAPKRPNEPKTDEEAAHVWILIEEGNSQREVARQTGFALATVQRILAKDPARIESFRSAKREERAKLWEQIEGESIKALRDVVRVLHHTVVNPATGKRRKKLTTIGEKMLNLLPRSAAVFRLAADSATTKAQLLTGGATARLDGLARTTDAADMTEEQLIAACKELGMVDKLPADLREKMSAELNGQSAEA